MMDIEVTKLSVALLVKEWKHRCEKIFSGGRVREVSILQPHAVDLSDNIAVIYLFMFYHLCIQVDSSSMHIQVYWLLK